MRGTPGRGFTTATGRDCIAMSTAVGKHTCFVQALQCTSWSGDLGEWEWAFFVDPAGPHR
jgi:hypothetical protein